MSESGLRRVAKLILAALLFFALGFYCLSSSVVSVSAAEPERAAGDGSLKARLELEADGPFYVGDAIPVALILEGASGIEYQLPEFGSEQLGGLELTAQPRVKREKSKDGWKDKVSYRFTGWQAGEYRIAGLIVNYQDSAGKKGSINLEELRIKISSLLPANLSEAEILADGLKDLKKPVGLPPNYRYVWFFVGGLLVLALLYLLVKRWRSFQNRKNHQVEQDLIIKEPAHQIALRRLEELRGKELLEKGEFKLFYDQLSEIVREYAENRFQIKALEMTTEEFLVGLRNLKLLNPTQKIALAEFLKYSDLVKFAKHQPLREEGERALALIYDLINDTKEQEESDSVEAEKASVK